MMAGNPGSWWSMISNNNNNNNNNSIPTSFYPVFSNSQQHLVESSMVDTQEFPQSWSQLLMGVLASDEDKNSPKSFDNFEYESLGECLRGHAGDVKQEETVAQEFRSSSCSSSSSTTLPSSWSQMVNNNIPTWPLITSCVTSSKTNLHDFPNTKSELRIPSSELIKSTSEHCDSITNGGAPKKAKVQSSNQPSLKIRKEKLGDRINALHQIVSPFGKTDTASVLTEAIGYIRFLHSQIEALSSPYLRNQQHSIEGHIGHCVIPEDSGQVSFIGSIHP
ncbi:transcription factor bHLH68-like [Impatiens glandulifera]|uniref:transcription factor bHLH68-like n=1 Tax=Impatiens glandulifera TaxID=253017 RepID=UPI001FB17A14|nr:transcription factor bHLH68-like [Impatiens glandulifera]